MRDLFAEYVAENADLMPFFARPAKGLFAATPKTAPWEPSLVEALTDYNTRLGGRPLFMGDEAVVATGQQPGLFTGPLYTIYKAMTAILVAKKVHDRFGVCCVPVFWLASDDHDFDEVRAAHFLTKTHETLTLTYEPKEPVDGLPMYRVPAEASLHDLIDQAASQTTGSEFRNEIATFLHESLAASASLADWTARLMARLFQGTPLIVFSPHLPAARALAAPVIEKEIRDPLVSTMLLNDCGGRLRDLGYHQQVAKGDTECSFFLDMGGRRRKVLFSEDRYTLPEEQMTSTIDELAQMLGSAPDRFSPNVALRCIVQQHLFPVAAYVAGPGELAYWAQLKPLFRHFGKEMPVVYPRARGVLTSLKLKQIMEQFQFTLGDLAGPPDQLIERALQMTNRAPAQEILQRHRAAIQSAIEPLAEDLDSLNKPAAAMARKVRERVATELDHIERAIAKADEDHVETVRKQVARLYTTVFPFRKPQERALNIFSFLFEHGWGLIPRLIKSLDVESFEVREIEL